MVNNFKNKLTIKTSTFRAILMTIKSSSKYIKIKKNQKLEAKFFGPFQVLYCIKKQAY